MLKAVTCQFGDMSYLLPLLFFQAKNYAEYNVVTDVVELGVRTGESTIALAAAVKDMVEILDQPARLTSIDIDPECEDVVGPRLESMDAYEYWNFIEGDSAAIDWTRPVDLLLIDTSHTKSQTEKELVKWTPLMKPGGIMWFHDTRTSPEGVRQPMVEFQAKHSNQWEFCETPVYAGLGWLIKKG